MPKCRFCGKKISRENAYLVKKGKSNYYYCNFEHSISKKPRDIMYEKINDIFGKKVTNTILFKEFDELAAVYGFEKCTAYMEENYDNLVKYMHKQFASEYAQIRYFAAIFKNNMGDYTVKEQPRQTKVKMEIEMDPISYDSNKKAKEVIGIDDLIGGLLDD